MSSPRPTGLPGLRGNLRVRWPGTRGAVFTAGVLLLLLAVEVAARLARNDLEEALPLAALVLLALLVRRRHRRSPLPWAAAAAEGARRVAGGVRSLAVTVGIDLRREPPVRRGFPPLLGGAVLALAAATLVLAAFPSLDAVAVRAALRGTSALLWLVLLGAGWALFAAGGFYLLFLTFALTHDELVRAHEGSGPRPRGREWGAMAGWIAVVLAGWALLPPWAPAAVHAGCLLLAAFALATPGGPDVPLLWKRRAPGAPVLAASWRAHTLAGTAWVALLLADATLFVHAGSLRGAGDEAVLSVLPFTAWLASLFAWTGAAALLAWCHLVVRTAFLARFRDPATPRPGTVFVTDRLPESERRGLRASLREAGFRARFAPARPRPGELLLAFGPGEAPAGALRLSPREVLLPETRRRLARRVEIGRRRLFLRGLEKLFRRAAGRSFRQGHGFWVAPWHWFCIGLSRDEDERALDWKEGTFFLETVGPAYHRVFPRPVLEHVHRVMRDLRVDLVFVEDGVGFRRLRRVLRMAFEVHDMLGERGRAEERHFTGLPGVRVLIHDFTMEEPHRIRREGYPEPDYDTVGRARILHVFRDRGESESPVDAPRDRRGVPVPA